MQASLAPSCAKWSTRKLDSPVAKCSRSGRDSRTCRERTLPRLAQSSYTSIRNCPTVGTQGSRRLWAKGRIKVEEKLFLLFFLSFCFLFFFFSLPFFFFFFFFFFLIIHFLDSQEIHIFRHPQYCIPNPNPPYLHNIYRLRLYFYYSSTYSLDNTKS